MKSKFILTALFLAGSGATLSAQGLAADTVCRDSTTTLTAASGNKYYNWNFDGQALDFNITALPTLQNVITGGLVQAPSYISLDKQGNNWYSFVVNYDNNHIIRLDYGASPLLTPNAVDLGVFGSMGQFASHSVVKDDATGNWYLVAFGNQQLIRLSFGNSLTNTPTSTVTTFPANLMWPHQSGLKKINGEWIAFVANRNGVMTRFNFGTSITSQPTVTNLPATAYNNPCYFSLYKEDNNWFMLVESLVSPSRLARLAFGTNINNNSPAQTDLGNLNNLIDIPRGITLFSDCNQDKLYGYGMNQDGRFLKLTFPSGSITGTPTATELGTFPGTNAGLFTFTFNNSIYALKVRSGENAIDRFKLFDLPSATTGAMSSNTQTHTFTTTGQHNIWVNIDAGDIMGTSSVCQTLVSKDCTPITGVDDVNGSTAAIMAQNFPNPFSVSTTIRYDIGMGNKGATFFVYDLTGRAVYKMDVKSGEGKIELQAGQFNKGMYFVKLYVDGNIRQTLKMTVQ